MSTNALRYIYFDPGVSTTVLQVTSIAATAVGERKVLIAVAKRAAAGSGSGQLAFYKAAVGELGLNEDSISPFSIKTSHLQANIIETVHISSINLTTLGANVLGTLHSAVVVASESFTAPIATFEGINVNEQAEFFALVRFRSGGAIQVEDGNPMEFSDAGVDAGFARLRYLLGGGVLTLTGGLQITDLPTSAAGLAAGTLWNDSGAVKVA